MAPAAVVAVAAVGRAGDRVHKAVAASRVVARGHRARTVATVQAVLRPVAVAMLAGTAARVLTVLGAALHPGMAGDLVQAEHRGHAAVGPVRDSGPLGHRSLCQQVRHHPAGLHGGG